MTTDDMRALVSKYTFSNGFDLAPDLARSHGSYMYDCATAREYLDMTTFFASRPIAFDHPGLRQADYRRRLMDVIDAKIPSKDYLTEAYARFAEGLAPFLPERLRAKLFFIDTGSLAVDCAIKTAMYYKANLAAPGAPEPWEILYFDGAFHGFSGYSLNVTDPAATAYSDTFARQDWHRFTPPYMDFSRASEGDFDMAAVERALESLRAYLSGHARRVAGIILEPIQGVTGDRYFPKPFFEGLRALCDSFDCLLIFDEVQTGMGITGRVWAFEHCGVAPDILCFGKKTQICGIAVTERVLSTPKNCFNQPGRLEGTFSGSLIDYVRGARIFEIIRRERLIENAAAVGERLRAGLLDAQRQYGAISGVRGRGMMLGFDLETARARDSFIRRCRERESLLLLGGGERSVRLRGALDLDAETADEVCARIRRVLERGDGT